MTDRMMPVQTQRSDRQGAVVRERVYMRAYEVYARVYGGQEAMITGGCRGGFGAGELVAFLYARSFPEAEWRQRCEEALAGMTIDK